MGIMKCVGVWAMVVAVAAMSGVTMGDNFAAPVAPKPASVPHSAGPRAAVMNPHLRGVAHPAVIVPAKKARPEVEHHMEGGHEVVGHHLWHERWNAVEWRGTHMKYGDITGIVVDASGRAVPNAHVWLQHPNGKSFSTRPPKHATNTDARGVFVMRHVLVQEYKLNTFGRGQWAKTGDHMQVEVRPGTTQHTKMSLKQG